MLREIAPGSSDFKRFTASLSEAGLPTDDLTSEPFRYFTADDMAWGGIGVGPDALIRSIVVGQAARGRGLGAALTEGLVSQAREAGVERLWLLTTSAAPFFEKLGWRHTDRALAPDAITKSKQFAGLCPASAAFMARTL